MASRIVNSLLAGGTAVSIFAAPLLAAPSAHADSHPVTGSCADVSASAFTGDKTQNLTVRKTQGNPYDDLTEGELPLGSIEGIEFKLYSVRGLRLSTDSGLSQAQHLTVDQARANGLDYVGSQRTDSEGSVTFHDLKQGMYLVEEIKPDDASHNYRTSDPFLVLLPALNADCETREDDAVIVVKSHVGSETTPPPDRTPPSVPPLIPVPPLSVTTVPPATVTTAPPAKVTTTTNSPQNPGKPGEPGQPGGSGESTGHNRPSGPLASTGANVIWALIVALAFIIGGVLLVRNRKDEESA